MNISLSLELTERMAYCDRANLTATDLNYLRKIYPDKTWAWWINHIGTLIICVIGFCGNLLCLLILCRRSLIRNSYTQYLIALAIVDTGAILSETLVALDEMYQYRSLERRSLFQHTDISCKFYYYIRYIFYSMSSWVVVALALERLVAIKFPLWSKYLCSVTNARRILCFILVFTMVVQSYHFVTKGLESSNSTNSQTTNRTTNQRNRCKTLRTFATYDTILTIYVWRLLLMTLLPLTVIITVNILIMSKLFNENSLLDHNNTSENARRKVLLLYRISRMLVIVSSIYLLLHVPGSSLEIIKFTFVHALRICNTKWQYYISITEDIFDLLTNFNYAINFYLYIISGKHIRREFMRSNSLRQVSIRKKRARLTSSTYCGSKAANDHQSKARSAIKFARCPTISSV